MRKFGEKNLDVLQNIEAAIVDIYRADRSLLDFDVKEALDALVRRYHAEEEQRRPPAAQLSERACRVFDAVQRMCELRLGRIEGQGAEEMREFAIPVAELVECLRQVQKSVPRWTKQGGRQGYLTFVSQYV